jgi:uncharacterized membrane protein
MLEIKKIKKISLANVFSFFSSLMVFFVVSGFYGYVIVLAVKTGQIAEPLPKFIWFNVGVGLLSALFSAFFAALVSWPLGFLAAGLYNVFAKRSGGIKVEVDGLVQPSLVEDKQDKLFPF